MDERIDQLHAHGLVDLHFDLLMDLYEKRDRKNVLATEFLPEFEAGDIGILGVAIYLEDRYLPEMGTRVALDQIRDYTTRSTNRIGSPSARATRKFCARARTARSLCSSRWKVRSRSAPI